MKIIDAHHTIDKVRENADECILFCSFGKDSLVLLDMLAARFNRVVCVFMYFVKGLEHVERWVRWAEKTYGNIEVRQIEHWSKSHTLRNGTYCEPQKVKVKRLRDVANKMREECGIDYVFFGMKKADGLNRRLMLSRYEDNMCGYFVYPLSDWTQKQVLAYIKLKKIPMPVRYSKHASSGVGFNIYCFLWLEKNFPQDLERIYAEFPMSRRILFEYHYNENGGG